MFKFIDISYSYYVKETGWKQKKILCDYHSLKRKQMQKVKYVSY